MCGTWVKDCLIFNKTLKKYISPQTGCLCWSIKQMLVPHLDSTWAQREVVRQTQWSRWPPNTGLNINMAWVWLRKERDPVYLWTCLCLGHNYRKIDRGDEGQRKRVEKQCVLTCGFFQYGQTVQSDPPTQKLDISVCLYASLAATILPYLQMQSNVQTIK